MNIVNDRLTVNEKEFFNKISLYTEDEIYFYGSIQRPDYIKGKSDIDVDIFTDNESSTVQKLCNLLDIKRSEFKNIVYKIDSEMVYGYKLKYDDVENKINVEMSIYNKKYKSAVLYDHNKCRDLPFYVTILLMIIKFLYYNVGIVPNSIYKRCKQFLMNKDDEFKFILMDI